MTDAVTWELQSMLDELESSRLEVILIPERVRTHEMGMIRCAISRNARWYRALCAVNLSTRRRRNLAPDTCIKRAQTVRTLNRLLAGHVARGVYADRLLTIARRRAATAARREDAPCLSRILEPQPF